MTRRERRYVSGDSFELGAIGHQSVQPTRKLVLEMGGLTPLRARERLHVLRSPPAWLQGEPPDDTATYV
jgi:hypothetical protein